MKARYAYPLLLLAPGALVAMMVAVLAAAAGAGLLWLFVYGDDPWPTSASAVLMALAALASLVVFAAVLLWAYRIGKAREHAGGVRKAHVLAALGVTIGLLLLMLLQQWQVGNLGGSRVPADHEPASAPPPHPELHDAGPGSA